MKKLTAIFLSLSCLLVLNPGDARADAPGSHLLLLAGENAQREISLTASQRKSIDRLLAEYRKEVAPFFEKKDARSAAMIDASMRAFDTRARALLSPEQRAKLYVVEAKTLGPWILHSPAIQKQLLLSERQVSSINRVAERAEAYNTKLHGEVDAGKITNEERVEKMRAMRIRESRSLEKILTSAQREQLRALAR
jgi:Spy/CpxP family protein refolding chaperone